MDPRPGSRTMGDDAAPTPLVIIGAGGFGREMVDLVTDINAARPTWDLLGFLDDGPVREDLIARYGLPWLGPITEVPAGAAHLIAIADPVARRRVDAIVQRAGLPAATLVHPMASLSRFATTGPGCVLAAGARVTTHASLGRHVHVNLNSVIGHDATLGDYVTLFSGVQVGGGVVIEPGVTLGTGCVILPGLRVGAGAYVGAGATVVRDVEPGVTIAMPAGRPTLGTRRPQLDVS